MWVIQCLSFFLVPSRSSNTPLYPQNVANQGMRPDSLLFHYFHFILTFESIKELETASVLIRPLWEALWNSTACIVLGDVPVTWYTHSRETMLSKVMLLIQSPTYIRLEYDARFEGMLVVMISLLVLLKTWEFNRRAGKVFHFLSSRSQRSFNLVQPDLAMVFFSLRPLAPRGLLVVLVMKGLPKMGCLSTATWDVGSVFTRPTLTFSQAPKMFLQNEQGVFLSFGVAKSQFMSKVLSLLSCISSWD